MTLKPQPQNHPFVSQQNTIMITAYYMGKFGMVFHLTAIKGHNRWGQPPIWKPFCGNPVFQTDNALNMPTN